MGIKFPIEHIVVTHHQEKVESIDCGTKVKCWKCGRIFEVTGNNVSLAYDDMELIQCPYPGCRYRAPVLYYYDLVVGEEKPWPEKKKRKSNTYLTVS